MENYSKEFPETAPTIRDMYAKKIAELRLMDDDFMRVCLRDNIPAVQRILDVILPEEHLAVQQVFTQEDFKNLEGHSVSLDVLASDQHGKQYNIEIQRKDHGASKERARYHVGMIDSHSLKAKTDYTALPEAYVIFITERDVLKRGWPIYHIERVIMETKELFQDGEHIIYVNGAHTDTTTDLGKLMADFRAVDPDKMYNSVLAERVRHFKNTEEGVGSMCKIMEDIANQRTWTDFCRTVKNMYSDGVSLEDIMKFAKYSCHTADDVQKAFKELGISI